MKVQFSNENLTAEKKKNVFSGARPLMADAQLPIWFRLYVSVPYLAFIDVQNRIVFLSLRQQKYPLRLSPREREYGSADQSTETLKPVVRQR